MIDPSRNLKRSHEVDDDRIYRATVQPLAFLLVLMLFVIGLFAVPSTVAQRNKPRRPPLNRPSVSAAVDTYTFRMRRRSTKARAFPATSCRRGTGRRCGSFPTLPTIPITMRVSVVIVANSSKAQTRKFAASATLRLRPEKTRAISFGIPSHRVNSQSNSRTINIRM